MRLKHNIWMLLGYIARPSREARPKGGGKKIGFLEKILNHLS